MIDPPTVFRTRAPKYRRSAYNFFFKAERQRLLREGNSLERIGLQRLITTVKENWRNASAAYKRRFHEMAREDRIRYERELQEYHATHAYLAATTTAARERSNDSVSDQA